MILEDLKKHIDSSVGDTKVYLNYDSSAKRDDVVLLWQNASTVSDVGEKTSVRVIVKCRLMEDAMRLSNDLFNAFYPAKQYQQLMNINGTLMYITASGVPFYTSCDESGRHCYVFELNITCGR